MFDSVKGTVQLVGRYFKSFLLLYTTLGVNADRNESSSEGKLYQITVLC